MTIEDCCVINLPQIADPRGNLTFIESSRHIPFAIERTYYLYDTPGGTSRGGHAHKQLQQFIIAISGSFDVTIDDGKNKKKFHLNRAYYGLYICPMIWRELDNFSSGAVCLALASAIYEESDYYRDYDYYLKAMQITK
jgi:dTDP-4-dehydrorhamnose 3,5-epimerase-like enzyme